MNKLYRIAIIAALAGFLFGFDTVVISGADQQLQALWGMSDLFHGTFIMAMALWGTVIGALFGGFPTDYFGRKNTLIGIGVLYFISALGSGLATGPYLFSFFRFIGGLGVGASTIAAPTYIAEVSPAEQRGRLVALYQFNIVFGILVAFLSNYLLSDFGASPWRWMVGIEAFPALLYCLGVLTLPKSPRWLLINNGDVQSAHAVFEQLGIKGDTQGFDAKSAAGVSEKLFQKKHRFPIVLAFLVAFFNQLSGINAFCITPLVFLSRRV